LWRCEQPDLVLRERRSAHARVWRHTHGVLVETRSGARTDFTALGEEDATCYTAADAKQDCKKYSRVQVDCCRR
jgi:hypothetical protein